MRVRCVVLPFIVSALACAQEYRAVISGQVTDPSGAPIGNAAVTATNLDTSVSVDAATGADGRYVLTQVPTGRYSITCEAKGFRKYIRSGFSAHYAVRAFRLSF
jgi:protocatechuate 3,4-dioxygenase beta subunit